MSEAENGRVALERLAQARPDLIFLDLIMPEMDGFEFLVEFRKKPDFKAVPVMVVTAASSQRGGPPASQRRGRRVLSKSTFSRDELLEELRELVTRHVLGRTSADRNQRHG